MGLWGYGVMGLWGDGGDVGDGVIRGYKGLWGGVFQTHKSDNNFDGTFPKRVRDARDLLGKVS